LTYSARESDGKKKDAGGQHVTGAERSASKIVEAGQSLAPREGVRGEKMMDGFKI